MKAPAGVVVAPDPSRRPVPFACARCAEVAYTRAPDRGQVERDVMATTQHPLPAALGNGHANPAEPSGDTYRHEPVPVSVLVDEAREAGVIDWLAGQISGQCVPHGMALAGSGGLLPALAAAAQERIPSQSVSVRVVVIYDPATGRITVDSDVRTTLATIRDMCLQVVMTCGDLHSRVEVRRDGTVFRRN